MQEIYAVIDIGTNSIRLMLARFDGQIHPTEKRLIITRIGDELSTTRRLSEEGMQRSIYALENFLAIAKNAKATHRFVFGTSALRDAQNANVFLQRCQDELDLEIDILSGEEEAAIAYGGAVPSFGSARLMDIGGGSTEFCAGKDGKVSFCASVPMGGVRLFERFEDNSLGHIEARRFFRHCVGEMSESGKKQGTRSGVKQILAKFRRYDGPLYGVGGTITTLCALSAGLTDHYDASMVQGKALTHGQARRVLQELGGIGEENRARMPILKNRADIICFGGTILLECMDALEATSIICSDSDNLEGYLRQKLQMPIKAFAAK